MDVLQRIVRRADLVLVMEIRDSSAYSDLSIVKLQNLANTYVAPYSYSLVLSDRLGQSTSKEQYAFLYRADIFEVVDAFLYPDLDDIFQREPYVVLFKLKNESTTFFVIPCHTEPGNRTEIDALQTVYNYTVGRYGSTTPGFITGDLNVDCTYVSVAQMANLALKKDLRLTWLIDDTVDTTTGTTDCAYDRFIVNTLILQMWNSSSFTGPFNFALAYGLNSTFTLDVSDHYPIEITFNVKGIYHTDGTLHLSAHL